jgi:hypothetical protein
MPEPAVRPRPPLFRALGAADPPAEIVVDGQKYERLEIFKHDSWAATALYEGASKRIVCKFNRMQPILGFPTRWLGKRLADRERSMLQRLADLPCIPAPCGPIYANGSLLVNAVGHAFVSGHPLKRREAVNSDFFPTLRETLIEMHSRGIAYVDLHKRENIIVGDDGRPYLVDFQISFDVTHPRLRWIAGIHFIFDRLCEGDLYHLAKHVRRSSPVKDSIPRTTVPQWLQLHRIVAVPFRELRRRFLVARGIRLGRGSVTTEAFAEDAVRKESAKAA